MRKVSPNNEAFQPSIDAKFPVIPGNGNLYYQWADDKDQEQDNIILTTVFMDCVCAKHLRDLVMVCKHLARPDTKEAHFHRLADLRSPGTANLQTGY